MTKLITKQVSATLSLLFAQGASMFKSSGPWCLSPFPTHLIWRLKRNGGFFVSHFDFTPFQRTDPWNPEEKVDRTDVRKEGKRKKGEGKTDDKNKQINKRTKKYTSQRIVNNAFFPKRLLST